jgi:hypothetical protein
MIMLVAKSRAHDFALSSCHEPTMLRAKSIRHGVIGLNLRYPTAGTVQDGSINYPC